MKIEDQTALVSGAGSGIGRATAHLLARNGARIFAVDVDAEAAEETARAIRADGGVACAYCADVSREQDVQAMFAAVRREYGELRILHNNAGILATGPRFPATPPERFMRVIDINLKGVLLATYHALPLMRGSGGGVIIQTASSASLTPHHHPIYAASKAGVLNFTRSLSHLREDYGIRVNCVCPGLVDTELGPRAATSMKAPERRAFLDARRALHDADKLHPEEVSQAVVNLVRDDSLTGAALLILPNREPELIWASEIPP